MALRINFSPLILPIFGNFIVIISIAGYFFLIPGSIVVHDLLDAGVRGDRIPDVAFRLHLSLSLRYERWASDRVASEQAAKLRVGNISGTEWPVFGSVFYLWATESLQEAWEDDPDRSPLAPNDYARNAIEAAVNLVTDPNHASWVKSHWGDDYLHCENIFYRMLQIAALTTHYKLTGTADNLTTLRKLVEDLTAELDESETGLLDDYPGQCFPGDVTTAIACIQRADSVLGSDHASFAQRALRGFVGISADPIGLPPYQADSETGECIGTSRGCSNSYICLFAPEVWPATAEKWYELYEDYYWQEKWTAAGFREFPNTLPGGDWYMDVDAGPVLAGHGISACAFGVGAARANGRYDHAYPLTAEMLAISWPLPNGILALPRLLSDAVDAPLVGEAAILFSLTRTPAEGVVIRKGGHLPIFVWLLLFFYFGIGSILVLRSTVMFRRRFRNLGSAFPLPGIQTSLWVFLIIGAAIGVLGGHYILSILLSVVALVIPVQSVLGFPNLTVTTHGGTTSS